MIGCDIAISTIIECSQFNHPLSFQHLTPVLIAKLLSFPSSASRRYQNDKDNKTVNSRRHVGFYLPEPANYKPAHFRLKVYARVFKMASVSRCRLSLVSFQKSASSLTVNNLLVSSLGLCHLFNNILYNSLEKIKQLCS